jgi:molybdate transport system substrate-binding protein
MNGMSRRGAIGLFLVSSLLASLTGYAEIGPGALRAQEANRKGPVIFAAASMKSALDAIALAWTVKTGRPPAISYASSGILAKQIEQGAPADVFVSADTQWVDYLDKAKLLKPGTRRDLLSNQLVLIAPADATETLKIKMHFDLAGATGDGKIAVCTIDSCPGGIYAKQALQTLGVWEAVEPKLAQADNIRSALALVARGEAKFGIVYATDAKAEPLVKVIDVFPSQTHPPIIYPVAVIADSKNPDAEAFLAFMTSQAAAKILVDQGFTFLSK